MCTIVLSAFSQSKVFSFVILVLFFSCWFERKNSKCEWASWKQSSYLFVAPLFFWLVVAGKVLQHAACWTGLKGQGLSLRLNILDRWSKYFTLSENSLEWKLEMVEMTQSLFMEYEFTQCTSSLKYFLKIFIYCAIAFVCLLRLWTCTWYTCEIITSPHFFFLPVFIKLSTAFYAACEPLYFHMAAAEHNAWCWTWCSTGEFYQLHHCVGTAVQTGPRLYL